MPKISSYANVTPADDDKILITDASDDNATKNVLVSALKADVLASPALARILTSVEAEVGAPASSLVIQADGTLSSANGFNGLPFAPVSDITCSLIPDTTGLNINSDFTGTTGGSDIRFNTALNTGALTERARIDASGNLLVGKTASAPSTAGFEVVQAGTMYASASGGVCGSFNRLSTDGTLLEFKQDNTTEGSISITGATTSYNTTSDYRKKENVVPMVGATERLLQLKPSTFNFISHPDRTIDGFLAHEAQAVVPEAVQGVKDEMQTVVIHEAVEAVPAVLWTEEDELPEGVLVGDIKTPAVEAVAEVTEEQPKYQQIDQSKLVPLLVATIQELESRIAALEV